MLHHVPLALQQLYGYRDERNENRDEKDGNKISGGVERVEIDWSLVCR